MSGVKESSTEVELSVWLCDALGVPFGSVHTNLTIVMPVLLVVALAVTVWFFSTVSGLTVRLYADGEPAPPPPG